MTIYHQRSPSIKENNGETPQNRVDFRNGEVFVEDRDFDAKVPILVSSFLVFLSKKCLLGDVESLQSWPSLGEDPLCSLQREGTFVRVQHGKRNFSKPEVPNLSLSEGGDAGLVTLSKPMVNPIEFTGEQLANFLFFDVAFSKLYFCTCSDRKPGLV